MLYDRYYVPTIVCYNVNIVITTLSCIASNLVHTFEMMKNILTRTNIILLCIK